MEGWTKRASEGGRDNRFKWSEKRVGQLWKNQRKSIELCTKCNGSDGESCWLLVSDGQLRTVEPSKGASHTEPPKCYNSGQSRRCSAGKSDRRKLVKLHAAPSIASKLRGRIMAASEGKGFSQEERAASG